MSANRDYLEELEQLGLESDQLRNALVAKTSQFHNLLFESGILGEILKEIKEIRKEMNEMNRKIEEIKMEVQTEKVQDKPENSTKTQKVTVKNVPKTVDQTIPIKEAIQGEWKLVEQKMLEGDKDDLFRFRKAPWSSEYKYRLECGTIIESHLIETDREGEFSKRIQHRCLHLENNHLKSESTLRNGSTTDRYIRDGKLHIVFESAPVIWKTVYEKLAPIKEVIGKWKMVEHQNFKRSRQTFEEFSRDLEFLLIQGKFKMIGDSRRGELWETDGNNENCNTLFVENDHLKTNYVDTTHVDRYVQNGKLYVIHDKNEATWTRIYERIPNNY